MGLGEKLATELEDPSRKESEEYLAIQSHNTLRVLMQDWNPEWPRALFSWRFFKLACSHYKSIAFFASALAFNRNPAFLAALRAKTETLLNEDLKGVERGDDAIRNLLSFYVMLEPKDGDTIIIKGLAYKIERIELTPTKGPMVRFIPDEDRVFSYGFTPVSADESKPSLLVHAGTGWPSAQGVEIQGLTNHWPKRMVGEKLYLWGKDAIDVWVDKQQGKIETMGQSLGGALATLTGLARGEKVARVDTLNAPGLYTQPEKMQSLFRNASRETVVRHQRQQYDPVKNLGLYQKTNNVQLIKVNSTLPDECRLERPLGNHFAHIRNMSANNSVEQKVTPIGKYNDSNWRAVGNFITYRIRELLFLKIAMMYFVVTPLLRYASAHKWQIALFSLLTVVLIFCPLVAPVFALPFVSAVAIPLITKALCIAYMGTNILVNLARYGYDIVFNESLKIKASIAKMSMDGAPMAALKTVNCLTFGMFTIIINFCQFCQVTERSSEFKLKEVAPTNYDATVFSAFNYVAVGLVGIAYLAAWLVKTVTWTVPKCILWDAPKRALASCFAPDNKLSADDPENSPLLHPCSPTAA